MPASPCPAPVKSGRQRPDGVRLEWETSELGTQTRGTFFPFLIRDFTDRNQRAFPQGKPVTKDFRGITRVVIAVKNLGDAIQRYQQAYGVPPPIKQADKGFEAYLALLGGIPVMLAQPLNAQSWLNKRIAQVRRRSVRLRVGRRTPGPLPGSLQEPLVRRRDILVRRRKTGLVPGL